MPERLKITYQTFNSIINNFAGNLELFHLQTNEGNYKIFGSSEQYFITCDLSSSYENSHFASNYLNSSTEVPSGDDALILGVLQHNLPFNKLYQADKAMSVTIVGREGSETIQATHDFTKKETWYYNSARVNNEILFDSGDGLTFSGSNGFWIDMIHGKVYDENSITEDIEHNYAVTVSVTGSILTAREPFSNFGGEYTINHRNGSVTFFSPPPGPVTASYSYATDSIWILKPYPSKSIDVEQAEIQFSKDVIINDSIILEAYGYVQIFAPQFWEENGGPLPTNYLVQLESTEYKTFYQIIDEALGSFPLLPQISGSNGRGTTSEVYGFPFRYGAVKRIYSKYGMEIRVRLKNNIEFGGSRATATFYCISRDENSIG